MTAKATAPGPNSEESHNTTAPPLEACGCSSTLNTAQGAGTPSGASQPNVEIANQLFAAVGGTLPRLFIQYPDVDQKQGAEALRTAVVQGQINGQAIIVPEI